MTVGQLLKPRLAFGAMFFIVAFVVLTRNVERHANITRKTVHLPLDFLEIGTSDFNTSLQAAASSPNSDLVRGVSVDAMALYLDRLPQLPLCHKLNAAVVGYRPHPKSIDVYYVHPDDISKYQLPGWLKGCNRVGQPHIQTAKVLSDMGLASLMQHRKVPVISIQDVLDRFGGCRIKTLKLDVEGLDSELLVGYVAYLWQNPSCYAENIDFEVNELTDPVAHRWASEALSVVGYRFHNKTASNTFWKHHRDVDARLWMQRATCMQQKNADSFLNKRMLDKLLRFGFNSINAC